MKQFYTLILCLISFATFGQEQINETTEQFDNLIVTTKTFDDGTIEKHLRTENPIPTDLTNWLLSQAPCGFSGGCPMIILGCCQGDGVDSSTNGGVCTFPEFQEYYCTVDLELVWDVFRLEHCTFTMQNGTSIINNGIQIVESTFCDVGDEVTQYIFDGGGNEFANMAEYLETLSIEQLELNGHKPIKTTYFDLTGKSIKDIKYASRGVYIKIDHYENNIKKTTKIVN